MNVIDLITIRSWQGVVALFLVLIALLVLASCEAFSLSAVDSYNNRNLTASWYSEESCRREGTSGVMANGRVFDDSRYTAASWDYDFGTILEITNTRTGKKIEVEVTDRGPNRKLYQKGRVIDLSKAAFAEIADLKQGIIPVKIKEK